MLKRKKCVPVPIKVVSVVDFRPGDTLVVESVNRIPHDVMVRLRKQLECQTGCQVLLLEAGLSLRSVLRGTA